MLCKNSRRGNTRGPPGREEGEEQEEENRSLAPPSGGLCACRWSGEASLPPSLPPCRRREARTLVVCRLPPGTGEEGGEGEERGFIMFVCLFVLSLFNFHNPLSFSFLCTLVLMALLSEKGEKQINKADPSLMIRFSAAPDQISRHNEVSFLTRSGRSLHHPITPSLCFPPFQCPVFTL